MNNRSSWQTSLSMAVNNLSDLLSLLELHDLSDELAVSAQDAFSTRVPREFVARMKKGDPKDPLLLQVLARGVEMSVAPGFYTDPLEEKIHNPLPGLLHKYPSRVLLTLAGGCAINCRYCFRRHFPYQDNMPGKVDWENIVAYIQNNSQINEVIFSGGDPMMVKDHLLASLIASLESVSHLKRIRIHTRLPIVIPSRVTQEWIDAMVRSRFQFIVVLHTNHPNEIDQTVIEALNQLRHAKITLLNQSVLLKEVNDDADTLVQLSERLFEAGVLPYYLHLLDKVQGAAHFDVSLERANEIMAQLKEKLPGFLVPKLAREVPGKLSKQY